MTAIVVLLIAFDAYFILPITVSALMKVVLNRCVLYDSQLHINYYFIFYGYHLFNLFFHYFFILVYLFFIVAFCYTFGVCFFTGNCVAVV